MVEGLIIQEKTKHYRLDADKWISGITAILFTLVFLLTSILVKNFSIFIIGGGLSCAGTALAHFSLNSKDEQEYIVQISDNTNMIEFNQHYKIIEDLGNNLYRVKEKHDEEGL